MGLDINRLRREYEQRKQRGGAKRLDAGKTRLRIVENPDDPGTFYEPLAQHFFEISKDNWIVAMCNKETPHIDQPCAICANDVRAAYSLNKDFGNALRAANKAYILALDLDDPESGLQVFEFPYMVTDKIISFIVEGYDFTDINAGHGVVIKKVKGKNNRWTYEVIPEQHPTPLDPDLLNDQPSLQAKLVAESEGGVTQWRQAIRGAVPALQTVVPIALPEQSSAAQAATPAETQPGQPGQTQAALPAPPADDVVDVPYTEVAQPVTPTLPECYGKGYDGGAKACLLCNSIDDCEVACLQARRAASKAAAAVDTPAATAQVATTAQVAATAAQPVVPANMSPEELDANLKKALGL
ncbi:MAG: hypothetical protein KMY53_16015 [Desulfarculus sp.]|nr:hypothetical protein [Pseudomonadota bacterium]MBU4599253.1 hypothetical protein [Pseudomonadota bacterium]MBV1715479.1 hypothetical protein [Desulfarculus sp.]MBV1739674.1 hypothetical protein [Desulfarculus sp.]